ncbi:MAG TPA: gliding motility protein GldC, partial [Trueperaceae bacterium]|nr:gliding motility protein GldC [Trueperaceae bacterium]
MTESKIAISVYKEAEKIKKIEWQADDSPDAKPQDAKAMILALWDAET